jgi:hypothetical protein
MDKPTPEINSQCCQLFSIPKIERDRSTKNTPQLPLLSKIRLFFRRHLDLDTRRKVKRFLSLDRRWQSEDIRFNDRNRQSTNMRRLLKLSSGDLVRVKNKEEILATLDNEGKLKGCSFISDMWKYCGTTQTVLKPVTRFVDERNYKVMTSKGLVLLKDVMCTGTDFYGRCDRSCLFFWREEWLDLV